MKDINTRKLISFYRKTKSKKALDCLVKNHQMALHKAISELPKNIISYSDQFSIANGILLNAINSDFDLRKKIKFTTYLIKFIKFRVIDEIRKEKKNLRYTDETYNLNSSFIDIYEKNEMQKKLVSAVQELERTKKIVIGCLLQNLSLTEISKQAGVSIGYVSQIYRSALLDLHKLLS